MQNLDDTVISIIIPTHNRFEMANRCLRNLRDISTKIKYEIILVDNNSSDDTNNLKSLYPDINYVFEASTAFSKARDSGANAARGKYLVFLDDDALLQSGALETLLFFMDSYKECGILAGRILPDFEKTPPQWAADCQNHKNAWSLYDPKVSSKGFKKVRSACGPLMAIRKELYANVGGFPPDTLGVENNKSATFQKWYVGPGDWGLCKAVEAKGYKIFYHREFLCYHSVSSYRMKPEFWYSRYFGEGVFRAISSLNFEFNPIYLGKYFKIFLVMTYIKNLLEIMFYSTFKKNRYFINKNSLNIIQTTVSFVTLKLFRNKLHASKVIWDAGKSGVKNSDLDIFLTNIPQEFLKLLELQYKQDVILPFSLKKLTSLSFQLRELIEKKEIFDEYKKT